MVARLSWGFPPVPRGCTAAQGTGAPAAGLSTPRAAAAGRGGLVFNMPCTKTALLADLLAQISAAGLCQRRHLISTEDEIKSFLSAHLHRPQKFCWQRPRLRMLHIPGKQSCSLRAAQGPSPNLGCAGSAAVARLTPRSPVRAESIAGLG